MSFRKSDGVSDGGGVTALNLSPSHQPTAPSASVTSAIAPAGQGQG